MAYVNFKNSPSEETPLTGGATGNLNVMQENGTSHGTDTKLGYAQSFLNDHIINVSNEVDEDYIVNFIKGKNLFDENIITNLWSSYPSGTINYARDANLQKIICKPGDTFTIKATFSDNTDAIILIAFYDSNGNTLLRQTQTTTFELTETAPANTAYMYAGHYLKKPTTIMLNEGSTALPYEPHIQNQIVVDNDKYSDTLNVGVSLDSRSKVNVLHSKNLLKYPYLETTKTQNGITFTDNGDGSITINGTATNTAQFKLFGYDGEQHLIEGNYVSGGLSYGRKVQVVHYNPGYTQMGVSSGSSSKIDKSTYTTGYVEIVIATGEVITTPITIYPMITYNEDNDYEPYITPSINVDREEIYSKKDTDIVDITNKLTFATGWSISDGALYKQGKHIFGTIQIKPPTTLSAGSNNQNVVMIPYTLQKVYIFGGFSTAGDRWGPSNGVVYIYLSSNGSITLSPSSQASYIRCQIDVVEA